MVMKYCKFQLGLLALLLVSGFASAATVLDVTGGQWSTNNDGMFTYGWEFDVVGSPVMLTHLGMFDEKLNGLAESHEIGVWDPSGTLLTSATIPSGTSAVLDGSSRMVDVTDISLPLADGYIIGLTNMDVDRFLLSVNSITETDPRIQYIEGRWADTGGSLERPTGGSVGSDRYFGPNFSLAPIPVPASLILFGSGLLGLLGIARRKTA